jgi:hypothetical protein
MASLSTILQSLPPKVIPYLQSPESAAPVAPPAGYGWEVAVTPAGDPFRTGQLIPTGITTPSFVAQALRGLAPLTSIFSGPSGIAGTLAQQTLSGYNQQFIQPPTQGRIRTMAFSDGDSGYFGVQDVLGGVNQVLQGQFGRDLLNIGSQALQGYVTQQFAPQSVSYNPLVTQAAAMPIIRGMAVVGRSFFNRFPALATAIQGFRNVGQNVTRSNLWGLMKRFGPDFLVTGGILTAAAVSELAIAGPGRRRMNPGNIKALRKAHRRMTSFHKICVTNDRLIGGRKRSKSARWAGGTQITQVK